MYQDSQAAYTRISCFALYKYKTIPFAIKITWKQILVMILVSSYEIKTNPIAEPKAKSEAKWLNKI